MLLTVSITMMPQMFDQFLLVTTVVDVVVDSLGANPDSIVFG